jgi:hypothetical protein
MLPKVAPKSQFFQFPSPSFGGPTQKKNSECISKCSLYTWKGKISLPEMGPPHSAPTWAGPYFGRAHSRLGLYSTL